MRIIGIIILILAFSSFGVRANDPLQDCLNASSDRFSAAIDYCLSGVYETQDEVYLCMVWASDRDQIDSHNCHVMYDAFAVADMKKFGPVIWGYRLDNGPRIFGRKSVNWMAIVKNT